MRLPSLLWIFWLIFLKIVPGAKNLKDLLVISPTSIIFVALSHLPSALLIIWLIFKKIFADQKVKKIYLKYRQSLTAIFCPKYTSKVNYLPFGRFLKNLYGK